MWTCPKCERQFKTTNQSHSCSGKTLDDLFAKSSDELILAFDRILSEVINWEPCSVGTAERAVVFTSKKGWLILRPMTKVLDLKFYYDEPLEGDAFHKIAPWGKIYAHHIRVKHENEITDELLDFLKKGHEFSLR